LAANAESTDGESEVRDVTRAGSLPLLVVTLALAAAMVGSLWIVDYLPTSDGHNHAVAGWVSAHLHDAGKGYDAFVEPGGAVTSLAFHAPFSALLRVLPWRDALRVTLSLGALIWAHGLWSVTSALAPRRAVVGLLGFATALSWNLYMGLFAYWICVGLDLGVLGFALRRPRWRWRDRIAIGAALAVVMLGHSVAAGLLGLMLGVIALARPSPSGRLRELGALALVSAPSLIIAYFSARGASRFTEPGAAPADLLGGTWLPLGDRLDILWRCFTGGPGWRGLVPLLAAFVGIGIAARRAWRGRASRDEVAVAAIAALMLIAVVTTPIHLRMWDNFAPRFLPFGVLLGLALLPVEELALPRSRLVAGAAIGVFSLASIGWAWLHHAVLSLRIADAMEVAELPIRRSGARLPIILSPPEGSVFQVNELDLMGHVFTIEQGGMNPYLYAMRPGLHPLVWKRPRAELFPPYPPRFYPDLVRRAGFDPSAGPREIHLVLLAMRGARYEDVILWGQPPDIELFEARGYVTDARRGGVALMHFSPCGLDVAVDAPGPLAAPLVVEIGWAPMIERTSVRAWAKGETPPDGVAHATFPDAPCGPVWARVFWDEDGSGDLGPGDGACAGAEQGRLHARVTREKHEIRCRRAPP
jgi:hypothetical protein